MVKKSLMIVLLVVSYICAQYSEYNLTPRETAADLVLIENKLAIRKESNPYSTIKVIDILSGKIFREFSVKGIPENSNCIMIFRKSRVVIVANYANTYCKVLDQYGNVYLDKPGVGFFPQGIQDFFVLYNHNKLSFYKTDSLMVKSNISISQNDPLKFHNIKKYKPRVFNLSGRELPIGILPKTSGMYFLISKMEKVRRLNVK